MGEIAGSKVRKIDDSIKGVAVRFGATVNGIMFGGGDDFKISSIITLQPADKAHRHRAGKIWILAIGFHAPSPARVTEKIDIGRPEG